MKFVVQGLIFDFFYFYVMGILNVMFDFFFDGGVYNLLIEVVKYVNLMINVGVIIIDIGGELMWSGVVEVSVEEEFVWVILVVEVIVQCFEVWILVDIFKVEVIC